MSGSLELRDSRFGRRLVGQTAWPNGAGGGAVFSEDQRHRYHLWRVPADAPRYTGPRPKFPLFVMLNPSTATHEVTDPTITRCANFARSWGYYDFQVVNLFSLRATDPKQLLFDDAPEGDPENLQWITASAVEADVVVCAWGVHGSLRDRNDTVIEAIVNAGAGPKLRCLGVTKAGHPRHPLYLPKTTPLAPYFHEGVEFDKDGVAF